MVVPRLVSRSTTVLTPSLVSRLALVLPLRGTAAATALLPFLALGLRGLQVPAGSQTGGRAQLQRSRRGALGRVALVRGLAWSRWFVEGEAAVRAGVVKLQLLSVFVLPDHRLVGRDERVDAVGTDTGEPDRLEWIAGVVAGAAADQLRPAVDELVDIDYPVRVGRDQRVGG